MPLERNILNVLLETITKDAIDPEPLHRLSPELGLLLDRRGAKAAGDSELLLAAAAVGTPVWAALWN